MGVLTDFFVASPSDLDTVLFGWQLPPPPLAEPVDVHGVNPFTKKPFTISSRNNRDEVPLPNPNANPSPNICTLPNVQCKSLLPDRLAVAFSSLSGMVIDDALDLIMCGALIGPPVTEIAIQRLPDAFTAALAKANNDALVRAAQAIEDADVANYGESSRGVVPELTDILSQIRALAARCQSTDLQLFVWISP
jgi:hypothetical protein